MLITYYISRLFLIYEQFVCVVSQFVYVVICSVQVRFYRIYTLFVRYGDIETAITKKRENKSKT